ncbi:uncharacterized protein [Onthophagus taurus]|uniref:uncharacterized protein n=1 Tax=Onthophagus taurus TaxID=166361 RepID=UPI0039BE73F3
MTNTFSVFYTVNTPNIPTDASVTASKPLSANHQTTEKIDSYKGIPDKCPSRCHLLINNKNPDIFSCSLCHQTTSIYNIPFKYSSEEIIVSNNQPMDYYVTKMKEVFLRQPIAKQEDNHKWDNFLNGNNSTVNGWSKAISTRTCTFCRRNSEGREFYESHSLKDSTGKVSCPVLRALKYPYCYADGYNAHTRKYCPLYKSVNETLPEPRRLANGTLASASNHK